MIPKTITKRDGKIVSFDKSKIRAAIQGAANDVPAGEKVMSATDIDFVTNKVVEQLNPRKHAVTVEHVQDLVELTLIEYGFAPTAKAYILYRADHARRRSVTGALMDIYNALTFSPAKAVDMKRENANVNGDSSMGTMLKYGSEGSKYFCNHHILPEDIASAHVCGDIHIHDEDFYMLTETCCQIDPLKLFKHGFSTGHGFLRPPKNIISRAALCCIIIQANQNEMHGGQSIPNFDFAMAPGVAQTFRKTYGDALTAFVEVEADVEHGEAVRFTKDLVSRVEPITMSALPGLPGRIGKALDALRAGNGEICAKLDASKLAAYAEKAALRRTERDTYQAMEALIHNLNTMNSRAGAQVPFSSINYGTDTTPEGRMVVKQLLLATESGLGGGETAIFPVQIFKMKAGVSYNEGDPNYDLFKLAIRVSAKRLFPNFSNLDAPFNLQYYKPGDYNTEVAYMGCRTRVMGNVHDPSREVTCGRGNLSFTSINLPRLALQAEKDVDRFFAALDDMIDLVDRQLLHRLSIQSARRVSNYPFLMGEGVWLDADTLCWEDSIGEILKHGTLTVGFIGLAEALVALTGKHHGESPESQELGLRIVQHMRDRMDEESRKTGLNFTLIATPAEGLSGRFVKLDKQRFGIVPGVTDRDYYTNSFHVPVYYPIKAFKKIDLEAPYHAMTNAGHITYVELDGDPTKNVDAFEAIIRYMHDKGVGYGSINHPLDRDPVCGYVGVIGDVCPRCGRKEGEPISEDQLLALRRRFPHVPHPSYGRDDMENLQ
ncbi:MAG: anaerobic ribonucleoside triphosphate reductase [Desulfovibrionaceae bacterium]|nr:anaerobic ribonucleoside triphosphate reductase [Desulfovibrionaceae bacterium]